ncbi:MAG: hypothetical protein HXN53_00115 [Prevotella nigrescens]|nr:hypothetical protein [Prevotella nigrescens]
MKMQVKYNYIYEKLVTANDDVLGLIAYGIYKQHKIEFITKIKEEQHRDPTEEECNSFFTASTTESQLTNYRSQAETLLSETVGNIASEELKHHEAEMLRNYKKEIKDCIPGNWRSFLMSVLAGVVSTILFLLIAGVFYFVGETSDRSNKELMKKSMKTIHNNETDLADSIVRR